MKDLDQFVTDEMLAAYIDGNAIPIEKNIIEGYKNNAELQEILDIVSDINNNPEIVEEVERLEFEMPDYFQNMSPDSLFQELKKDIDKQKNNII